MGWDVQPRFPSQEIDSHDYWGAADISSGATSMFAPDPVFFYTSSRTDYVRLKHDWYDTSTPFFITNKGLSVSLPVHESVSRWPVSFPSLLAPGQQAPLVTLCLNGSELDRGRDLWLKGVALFLAPSQDGFMSYTRCWGKDEHGRQPRAMVFRGPLLSFSMPSSLFKHHFRLKSMFVRATHGCQSLFAWDQTPEVAVVILSDCKRESDLAIDNADPSFLSKSITLASSLADGLNWRGQLQTGTLSSGAIYCITRYADDTRRGVNFQFYVLVRAAKRSRAAGTPDEDAGREMEDPFFWRCDLVSKAPKELNRAEDGDRWKVGGRSLTLSEILDLPMEGIDDGPIQDQSVLVRTKDRDKERGKDVTTFICVHLTGRSHWVTNPASSIKFLHVTEEKLGI
jgi:hypothetical protein